MSGGVAALFSYLTYAALPVRLHEAAAGGLGIAAANLLAHFLLPAVTEAQVTIYIYG